MPIKLIGAIILLILVTIFAGVNLDNICDINFIFHEFNDIPVFMTVIISFIAGALFVLPFTFSRRKKKQINEEKAAQQTEEESKTESKTLFDFKIKREAKNGGKTEKAGKKSLFGFGKNKEKEDSASTDSENTGAPV